jgi:hypothetical protein
MKFGEIADKERTLLTVAGAERIMTVSAASDSEKTC